MSYICIAEKGPLPPRVKHESFDEAIAEAKRLHRHGLGAVMVAELKAVITSRDVPVVKREVFVEYEGQHTLKTIEDLWNTKKK